MRHVSRFAVAFGVCALAAGFATSAFADGEGDYGAKGVPLGGFRLFPTLTFGADSDDNVYRTDAGALSDTYFLEMPGFSLLSQWGRHELDLYGSISAYQYSTHRHEDHNDSIIGGNGRLDVLRGIDIVGGASYNIEHESRNSPDQVGLAERPTEFALTSANAAFEYHPYHFNFTLGGTLAGYNYNQTIQIGVPPLDNSDRNRDEYEVYAKGAYEFSPGYATYLQVTERDVNYSLTYDRNGLRRSNHGYSVNAGLDMAVTDLIQGQVFVGYLDETYKAPLTDISGFTYGANVDWDVAPLWKAHLTASRILNGTTINGASAEDDQSVRGAVDFTPQPNLAFEGYVGYLDENFNGTVRDDKYTSAGLSLKYFLNHNMSAQVGYDYQDRNSSLANQNFTDNHFAVRLNLQL